ncbi:MAG: hypothetical protein KAT78_02790, partial [Flavobacteriaceae bacterium]|nr:hypothetical protein [Flavobacteriaceae bacterium]
MKKILQLFIIFFTINSFAQNGKIIDRQEYNWKNDTTITSIIFNDGKLDEQFSYLNNITIEKITYLSDGLKVKGYLVQPNKTDKYPCIVYNRGGNKEFGKLSSKKAVFILARVASWGYVVAASQYRGNDGGEGKEEFGGKDV